MRCFFVEYILNFCYLYWFWFVLLVVNVFSFTFFDFKPKPKPIPTIKPLFFFDHFLMISKLVNFKFYLTKTSCSINLIASNQLTFLFFLMYKTNPLDLYYVINRYATNNESKVSIHTIFRSVFWNFNLHTSEILPQNEVVSLSTIYTAFVWLERELKETSVIQIIGLKDARRLLSDYGQTNILDSNHYYDLLAQQVI